MKRRILISFSALALALPFVAAGPVTTSTSDDTEIAARMKVINNNMKSLRKLVRDAGQNGESLKLVLEMQQKALEAKSFDPIKLSENDGEAAQSEFRLEFRQGMHKFINAMFDLEVALLSGDNQKAEELYKVLGKAKSPAHKQFKAKK